MIKNGSSMVREKGARVLRTPPGYDREHQVTIIDRENEFIISPVAPPVYKSKVRRSSTIGTEGEDHKTYINENSVNGKQYLNKMFEMKNKLDVLYLENRDFSSKGNQHYRNSLNRSVESIGPYSRQNSTILNSPGLQLPSL